MACDPSSPSFCCYNIPICGGFCAPTENPDTSCYRHVSNEYTIPASPRFMQLAPACEFSPCCVFCGKLGVRQCTAQRKPVFTFAAAVNLASLILCIIAALSGFATEASTLERLPWVKGTGKQCIQGSCADVSVYIGITARYVTSTSGGVTTSQVSKWDDGATCNALDQTSNDICKKCKDNLIAKSSLIFGIIGAFPTIATDLQRTTIFGDVNCQNTMGIVTNLFSFVMTLWSLISFRIACYMDLPDKYGGATMDWDMGPGFRCLMLAVIIKLIDVICHLLVQTPQERWRKPEKELTSVTDYMKLCGSPVEIKKPDVVGVPSS